MKMPSPSKRYKYSGSVLVSPSEMTWYRLQNSIKSSSIIERNVIVRHPIDFPDAGGCGFGVGLSYIIPCKPR